MGAICRLKVTALLACALSAAKGNVIRKAGKIRMPEITSKTARQASKFKWAVARNPKPQTPNPKKIPNGQIPRSEALSGLRYFRAFGIWDFVLSVSLSRQLQFVPRGS